MVSFCRGQLYSASVAGIDIYLLRVKGWHISDVVGVEVGEVVLFPSLCYM